MIAALANSLWLAACLPEYRRFRRAVARVAGEQAALLKSIVSANADTEFGRMHGFGSVRCVSDFQNQVPMRDYDGHQEWISRAAAGEKRVLTSEPVRLFEPTSGSTDASKLVPYTSMLQRQFSRGVQAWIADLFLRHPELLTGHAYWSVSPVATKTRYTSGGIPIGFEDDAAYLGGWQQRLVDCVMAVPGTLGRIEALETVRYFTLFFLVRCRDLRLISVWNPTFLSLLMEFLPQWGEEIAGDLEKGAISCGSVPKDLLPRLHPSPKRARELRASLRSATAGERHASLWPDLRLISCWTDANAAAPAAALQMLFPQAKIQGKGLLATEGLVSIPLAGHDGAALAVRSHFFEFLPVGPSGEMGAPQLAHEMEQGRHYGVVMTTGGGLYRYRTGDLVEVTGHFHGCPLLQFLGRHDQVSDWFGEKLNEVHVGRILRQSFQDHAVSPSFAMLACDTRTAPAYVLYVEAEAPDSVLNHVGRKIEASLCGNSGYYYARQLGQLAPLKVFRAEHAAASYLANAIQRGQRSGDVKPVALDRRDMWSQVFRGRFVS